jgi:mannitol-1-/sugar-/sorbitol-6-phosphatase
VRVDAVLCDLDGVLVDSTPAVLRTWRRFAARHGLDPARVERTIHGRPARESVRALVPTADAAAETALIDEWELADLDDVRALPGAHALRRLLGDDRFAVVTSCNERLARARLEAVGLAPPRVLVTIDSVRAGKPDPECYLLAASRLGVPPARCLVLEDAPVGLAAARSAGMATVAVTTTHAPAELDADLVVGTIADLLQARKLLLPAA